MANTHLKLLLTPAKNVQANSNGPRLKPKMDAQIEDFLQNHPQQMADYADAFGSPLNVMFPQVVSATIQRFQDVYARNHLTGRIFFTTKPNKSMAVKRQAALEDIGVDVSSHGSLLKALAAGFDAGRMEATGPKSLEYLTLAVQQNVIINADNLIELEQIVALRKALGLRRATRLFVRLSGFHSTRMNFTKQDGTFGVHVDKAPDVFAFLKAHKGEFDFMGFAYHVPPVARELRVVVMEQALQLTFEAMKQGLQPKGLNIGGGFQLRYADSQSEWADYTDQLKKSVVDSSVETMSWNGSGLGHRNLNGLVSGAPVYKDHYIQTTGADELHNYLNMRLPAFGGQGAAEVLSENMLDLFIEPGYSMLDQTGITVARVNYVKDSTFGQTLVVLDMNRSNLHSTNLKLMTEPVLLPRNPERNKRCENGVFYVGNLCVMYDILQYNKTFPDLLPEPGDLVAFINTAPYMMDFIESETLHQRVADKVAVAKENGRFRFYRDELYQPAITKTFDQAYGE